MAKRTTEKQLRAERIWITGRRIVAAEGQEREVGRGLAMNAASAPGFQVSVSGPLAGEMLFDIWADWNGGKKVFSMRWTTGNEPARTVVSFKRGDWEAAFLELGLLH